MVGWTAGKNLASVFPEIESAPSVLGLLTADANQGSTGEHPVGSGAPKGDVGDQQYEAARGTDLDRLTKVVLWCRAFSAGFGAAALRGR